MIVAKCNKCLRECKPFFTSFFPDDRAGEDRYTKLKELESKYKFGRDSDFCLCFDCTKLMFELIMSPRVDMIVSHELGTV